jgi:cytochrome c553
MKYRIHFRRGAFLVAGVLLSGVVGLLNGAFTSQARAQPGTAPRPGAADEAPDMRTVIERLPDQAKEMTDVAYHFANLWFAAGNQNWPLADYYLRQTRAYLKLAVQAHQVRTLSDGTSVDLKPILDAVDKSSLAAVGKAIADKDAVTFKAAYRQTLGSCYTCHAASEKPYLRLQIPTAPSASNINFDPNPTGPE